jgi:DNA-binding GntR family transcriptional regulator
MSSVASDRIVRQSLHEEVAERVRARIYDEQLAPGQRIDELALAAELGISRTPLREALKVLAAEGLVLLVPGKGAYVASASADELDELFPVMALLEGRCAHEAVRKLDEQGLHRLAALHAELERHAAAGDLDHYYASNVRFHEAIESLARNAWLTRVTGELRRFLRLSRGRQLRTPGRLERSLAEHRALMRALRERDAAAAERLMHDHLLAQQRALRRLRAPAGQRG